jgi:hypothetical protein
MVSPSTACLGGILFAFILLAAQAEGNRSGKRSKLEMCNFKPAEKIQLARTPSAIISRAKVGNVDVIMKEKPAKPTNPSLEIQANYLNVVRPTLRQPDLEFPGCHHQLRLGTLFR